MQLKMAMNRDRRFQGHDYVIVHQPFPPFDQPSADDS